MLTRVSPRRRATLAGLALGLGLVASPAVADRFVSRASSWNAARTAIHTDVIVERDDGRRELVRVPGGSVDGLAMRHLPLGPFSDSPLLRFVRERTAGSGAPLAWQRSCVFVRADATGTVDLAGDDELAIIERVLAHWETETEECSYLRVVRDTPTPAVAGYDGENVITFHEDAWCAPGGEVCYEPSAMAVTNLFHIDRPGHPSDGTLVDADIELNAVHFAVSACDDSGCTTTGEGPRADLANVLTHEVGHLFGLDHTCFDGPGGPSEPPLDGAGQPVPRCEVGLPAEITDATMFNYSQSGEIHKATLEPDDVEGLCAIYPRADDPGLCARALDDVDEGCCAVAPGHRNEPGTTTGAGLFALAIVLLAARARARRKRGG